MLSPRDLFAQTPRTSRIRGTGADLGEGPSNGFPLTG